MAAYPVRFACLALAAGLTCFGQARAQPRPPVSHQSWSTDSGLPQNSVHQIIQTHDGFLWLATEGGAVRYDGFSFKTFNHETDPAFTSNDVSSLAEDRQGNLWIGTADGMVKYDGNHSVHFGELDGLPTASVSSIASAGDGSLLVLTSAGLAKFDGTRFQRLKTQELGVNETQPQPDGSVTLVGKAGLALYKNGSISHLPPPGSSDALGILGVLRQPNGTTWFWTDHEVQAISDGDTSKWRIGQGLPGTRIQTVVLDRSGRAWIGTNRGLATATRGHPPEVVGDLGTNSILSILEDAEGNLWIGTDTSGLHALRPRAFRADARLADEEVSCVAQASDGSIWIGTRHDGLRRVRQEEVTNNVERPVRNDDLTSPVILSLAPGLHGDVWVGTPDGLTHVSSTGTTSRYTSSDGLPDDFVRSLLAARDGTLWIGTRHGLARLREGRLNVFTAGDGPGADQVGPLFETKKGDIWVGTASGISQFHTGVFSTYGAPAGLGTGPVTGITEDSTGQLWVSTQGSGVLLWKEGRFQSTRVTGLPADVYGLIADSEGFLWLRGRRSIFRISVHDLTQCVSQSHCETSTTTYTAADGIPSEQFITDTRPSMWRTLQDELWFATRKGVAIATPAVLPVNKTPPPVAIESFSFDGKEVSSTSGVPSLASGPARYTFEYAGLSYTIPSKVLYKTKLEGFDSDWTAPTVRRNASYTNLPAGTYTFRVQAANNDGVWNLTGAQLEFKILPPFYRRWWFLLAATLTLASLIVIVYRLRMRRLRFQYEAVLAERNRIAREIHDTLAQDLVGISVQLNLVSQLLNRKNIAEAAQQLTATRQLVTEGLEEARRSIWNLRTTSASDSLPSKLTALAKRYSTETLTVKTRIGGTYRDLPDSIENEVLRIVQEAITNVQRHASATTVEISCQYGRDKLVATVKDNGRGFTISNNAVERGHFGLQGMRERAGSVGGELRVSSAIGTGSVVELIIPIGDAKGSEA